MVLSGWSIRLSSPVQRYSSQPRSPESSLYWITLLKMRVNFRQKRLPWERLRHFHGHQKFYAIAGILASNLTILGQFRGIRNPPLSIERAIWFTIGGLLRGDQSLHGNG